LSRTKCRWTIGSRTKYSRTKLMSDNFESDKMPCSEIKFGQLWVGQSAVGQQGVGQTPLGCWTQAVENSMTEKKNVGLIFFRSCALVLTKRKKSYSFRWREMDDAWSGKMPFNLLHKFSNHLYWKWYIANKEQINNGAKQ
jgi:hypothetical protein